MRKPWSVALLLPILAITPLAVATARASDKALVRDERATFPLQGAHAVDLDVPVGEVHVTTTPGDQVLAHLELRCDEGSSRCRSHATALHLVPGRGTDTLTLKLDGYDHDSHHGFNHPDADVELMVPAALAVHVHVGVGDLRLRGIEGDVGVEIGVGDARVEVPESAVHAVNIDVGVGDANLDPRPDTSRHKGFLFLGNNLTWHEGTGQSHVAVEVGIGDASVRLLP